MSPARPEPQDPELAAAGASGSLSRAESAASDPAFSKGLTASATQGRVDVHAVNMFFKVSPDPIAVLTCCCFRPRGLLMASWVWFGKAAMGVSLRAYLDATNMICA